MGKKLLVADDSVTIQKVIKLALSSEGYEIVAANGGHEVIQAIQQEQPDIVLIDASLPDMNAYDVKRAVDATGGGRARFVLMYSAFERIDDKQADSLGFQGRLVKPFDPSNLRKLIADLLRQAPTLGVGAGAGGVTENTATLTNTGIMELTPPPVATVQHMDLPPLMDEHPIVSEGTVEHLRTGEFSMDVNPMAHGGTAGSIDIPIASQEPDLIPEPPVPPVQGMPQPRDNDIRNLTDSTMQQIAGLDFGGWNIDESRKMKDQSKLISMPPQGVDDGGSSFLRDVQIPKPAGGAMKSPQRPGAVGTEAGPRTTMGAMGTEARPRPAQQTTSQPLQQHMMAPATEALEGIARVELERILERLVRESMPKMAEAIIKRELDRLLSEP
jgi:CheY-like chemotaxis protein